MTKPKVGDVLSLVKDFSSKDLKSLQAGVQLLLRSKPSGKNSLRLEEAVFYQAVVRQWKKYNTFVSARELETNVPSIPGYDHDLFMSAFEAVEYVRQKGRVSDDTPTKIRYYERVVSLVYSYLFVVSLNLKTYKVKDIKDVVKELPESHLKKDILTRVNKLQTFLEENSQLTTVAFQDFLRGFNSTEQLVKLAYPGYVENGTLGLLFRRTDIEIDTDIS